MRISDWSSDVCSSDLDLLDGWPGTIVVVSHDRYLLERVADRQVALLGDGSLRNLPGGVDEYLPLRAAGPSTPGASGPGGCPTTTTRNAAGKEIGVRKRWSQRIPV